MFDRALRIRKRFTGEGTKTNEKYYYSIVLNNLKLLLIHFYLYDVKIDVNNLRTKYF